MLVFNHRTIIQAQRRNEIFCILFFLFCVDGLVLDSKQTSGDPVPSLGTPGTNSGIVLAPSSVIPQDENSTKTLLELLTSPATRPLHTTDRTLSLHYRDGRSTRQPPSDSINARISSVQNHWINVDANKSKQKPNIIDMNQNLSPYYVNEHRTSHNDSESNGNKDTDQRKTERKLAVSNNSKRNEVFLFSSKQNKSMTGESARTSFSNGRQNLKETAGSKGETRTVMNEEGTLTVLHELPQNDSMFLPIPENRISMIGDAAVTSKNLDFSAISAYMRENVGRKKQLRKLDSKVVPLHEIINTLFQNYAYGKCRVDRNHLRLIKDDRERIAHLLSESRWLESVLRLDNVLSSYPDLLALRRMTEDLSLAVTELIRFSTSKIDGLMLPSQGSLGWSQMVLHGDSDRQPISAILSKLHQIVKGGTPQFIAGRSVFDVYAERISVSSRQSKAWHVEAFFHNLALLQTLGTACILSALNRQDKDTLELKLAVKEDYLKTRLVDKLKHQLHVQRSRLANLKGRDLDVFQQSTWDRFSSFTLKSTIVVDVGIVGISAKDAKSIKRPGATSKNALIPSDRRDAKNDRSHRLFAHRPVFPCIDLPNLRNVTVAPISGCQFINKDDILALRCSHKTNHQCHKGKNKQNNVANSSDIIFQQEFSPANYLVGLTEKCTRTNLTCVDTRWVTSSDPTKAVCAVKLMVGGEGGCLSIGAYFCDKNPCSRNRGEWSKREQTKLNRRKKKTVSKCKPAPDSWGAYGWNVDSQVVDPQLRGWTKGVRLRERGGRLSLELKTTFY